MFPYLWFKLHLLEKSWIVIEALQATKKYFPPGKAKKVYLSRWLWWGKSSCEQSHPAQGVWNVGGCSLCHLQRCSWNCETCSLARGVFLFVIGIEGFKLKCCSIAKARVDSLCHLWMAAPFCFILPCDVTAWNSPSQPRNLFLRGDFLGLVSTMGKTNPSYQLFLSQAICN